MRNLASPAILTLAVILIAAPAFAAKINGSTTLKDVQPTGTTDKEHKHQAYDLSFNDNGKSYTCRTNSSKSMDATDFVVGTQVKYEVNGNKGKIETPEGKKVDCKIVRVEASPATP